MAEVELSALSRQCLRARRFATAARLDDEVSAWVAYRNAQQCGTNWRFTTSDARVKLQSLYPQSDD